MRHDTAFFWVYIINRIELFKSSTQFSLKKSCQWLFPRCFFGVCSLVTLACNPELLFARGYFCPITEVQCCSFSFFYVFFLTIQYEIFVACMRIVKIWFRTSLFNMWMFLSSACKVKFSLMYSLSAQNDILTIMKVIVSTFLSGPFPFCPSTHSLEFEHLLLHIGQ